MPTRESVRESGEDTHAVVPERHAMMRGPLSHSHGVPGERERRGVGDVVAGAREQSQAVRPPSAEGFSDHERNCEPECGTHRPAGHLTGHMAVARTVSVTTVIVSHAWRPKGASYRDSRDSLVRSSLSLWVKHTQAERTPEVECGLRR
jgi:hypothetical protein